MGFEENYTVENMLKTSNFKVYLLNMVKLNSYNDCFRRVKYSYKNYILKDMPLKPSTMHFKRGVSLGV